MRFAIRGVNVEVTGALADYVERKLGRLEKYFDHPLEGEVMVKMAVRKDGHCVEATVPFYGTMLRAEELNDDMYAAIDRVEDKLERQVRKWKTKVLRKYRGADMNKDGDDAYEVPEEALGVARTKRFAFKPMDADEAILQMNLIGHDFYVFRSAETGEVNVVYKRKDGTYGVIAPL